MKDFFDLIYGWTNGLYAEALDNYLFDEREYIYVGWVMIGICLVVSAVFYYGHKPVRKQMLKWFLYLGVAALLNFVWAWFRADTPLRNNQISSDEMWAGIDCVFFGFANVLWTIVFFFLVALVAKWWSPNKYVPFQKF